MQWKNLVKRFNLDNPEERVILLICMGIALLFWIFIKLSQDYSAVKSIQFQVTIPEDKTLIEPPPKDMKIEMRGSGWDLLYDFFISQEIKLSFNLQDQDFLSRSRNQLLSDIRNKLYSKSLDVRSLNYDGIQFRLDDKLSKKVPVKVHASLNFAPGYQQKQSILIDPDSISITGPASLLDSITYWPTDSLVMSNISVNLSQSLNLQKTPPSLSVQPQSVNLSLNVEQFTENTLFVPLEIQNGPDSILRIFPKNVSVNYIVGISQFNTIQPDSFKIIADFADIDIYSPNNKVGVQLTRQPKLVRNVSFSPKTASFFILQDSLQQNAEKRNNQN